MKAFTDVASALGRRHICSNRTRRSDQGRPERERDRNPGAHHPRGAAARVAVAPRGYTQSRTHTRTLSTDVATAIGRRHICSNRTRMSNAAAAHAHACAHARTHTQKHTHTHTHRPAADTLPLHTQKHAAPTEEPFVPDQVHFSIVINCNPQPIHPRSTRTRTRMRARAHTHTETALNE